MRIAYLECFAGISGDMFLGALLDAGVPASVLHQAAAELHIDATLKIEKVDRSGITATKVHVLEDGQLAEAHRHTHTEASGSSTATASAHADSGQQQWRQLEQPEQHTNDRHHHPETQHLHKIGHTHGHQHEHTHDAQTHEQQHEHTHGRSLTVIRELIHNAHLAEPVKNFAITAFELLGASEAKIHNVPLEQIHFHEVGAVDAIVDIVCASAGIEYLNQQALSDSGEPLHWHCSPLNVGGGMVQCAHGNFPVPAPATADLLRGLPTYSAHLQKELVTPTGAALVRALAPGFGTQPPMSTSSIGYGAGTRNPAGFPNVLRLSLGESVSPSEISSFAAPVRARGETDPGTNATPHAGHAHDLPVSFGEPSHGHTAHAGLVTVLETALDDLNPQVIAWVTEQALALGAFDVMTTPVGMKKGRPGTLLTILTDEDHSPALERLLLRETTTLGIRVHQQRRICLDRHHISVTTPFGDIRIKIGSFDSEAVNAAPEFEDCRAAAVAHNVPVKRVLQAAVAAYVAIEKSNASLPAVEQGSSPA